MCEFLRQVLLQDQHESEKEILAASVKNTRVVKPDLGGPSSGGLDSEVINVRTRCTGRDGVEPSGKLRSSHCSQANLPASAVYILENVGKGGETCQSLLLTSENAQQQLILAMYNNGRSTVSCCC